MFAPVVLVVCALANSAECGLQSALTVALTPLRIPTSQIGFGVPLIPLEGSYDSPAGSLFIDPVDSTFGAPAYRSGPSFTYDPATGGVSLSAPPMLGPADEFGVRQTYSPHSLGIFADGFFSETPTLPRLTKYRRAQRDYTNPQWEYLPFGDDDPSFVLDDDDDSFSVSVSSEGLDIYLDPYWRSHSGVEVEFSSVLDEGLGPEVFESDGTIALDVSIWPYPSHNEHALPDVYFVVNYETDGRSSLFSSWFTLLAVPESIGLEGNVPEPATIVLAFAVLTGFLANRCVLRDC